MQGFEIQFKEYLAVLERELPSFLPEAKGMDKQVMDAMSYSLLSGGKRIRAVLLMACYRLFSDDFTASVPFAAAVEMIHAYSLIHDDLPCMDDADTRRGKPSCHAMFGEATALLAGDGLLTLAFETMSRGETVDIFGAEKTVASIRALSRASGAGGMVGGQMLDIENENRNVDLDMLILMDSKKTGALIMAACEIGCILGGAAQAAIGHAVTYASKLGLAFQIIDDVLDITSNPGELGKPTGSDHSGGKTTYASLYGPEKAAEIAKHLTGEAIGEISETGLEVGFLCELAKMLEVRKF